MASTHRYNRHVHDDHTTRRPIASLPPIAWVVALAGPVVVSTALVPLRSEIRTSNVSLVLVLVILGAAVLGGRLAGAISAIVATASFDFFFTRPYSSFTVNSRDDVETAVLLLAVGIAVGELVFRARRSRLRADESRAEVVRVRRLSELAAGGESRGRLIGIVQGELVSLLPVRECHFEPRTPHDMPELTHKGLRIPGSHGAGARTPLGRVALPVFGGGRPMGRFVLDLESGPMGVLVSPEDQALALALADQLGTVLASEGQF
ncbi:MAG: DUF4118 domain-containing protein [Acidimicrobiia bacterium]